jgi:DNA-directed RNA polymerase alpha subunit
MLCNCGKLVEPAYEQNGKCENCFVDACDGGADVYKDEENPVAVYGEEALMLPISGLEISARTINRLASRGIIYIRDLVIKTEVELTNIPHFGDMALYEVKKQLQIFGLALKQQE